MQIYPAIDLKDGQGVRLKYGDFDQMTVYAPDPAATAAEFVDIGCSWIHVVDLDGALQGKSANIEAVAGIVKSGAQGVRPALQGRPDLSRQAPGELGPETAHRDFRP